LTQPGSPKTLPALTQPGSPKTLPALTQPGSPKTLPALTQPGSPCRILPILHVPRRRLRGADAILATLLQDARRRLVEMLRRVLRRQRTGFHIVEHRRQIADPRGRRLVDRRRLVARRALDRRLARLTLCAAGHRVGAGLRPLVLGTLPRRRLVF